MRGINSKILSSQIDIGGRVVRNRVMLPALAMGLADELGRVTEEVLDFYGVRAEGGAGAVVVGGVYPERRGRASYGMLGLDRDDEGLLAGYRELALRIRAGGSLAIVQLLHAGRYAPSRVTGEEAVAPSPVFSRLTGETPDELGIDGMEAVRRSFAEAARRATAAGFDGVELHAGMGYLLNQFLSPFTNRRSDRYGGGIEGRARFLVEVLEEVRRAGPMGFLLGVRVSMDEFMEGGNGLQETREVVRILDAAGIHYLSVVVGWHESGVPLITREVPPAHFAGYAEEAKGLTDVPVVYGTRVMDLETAERVVSSGKADMVAMGRALIADPYLIPKYVEGAPIRPCIACSHCLSSLFSSIRKGVPEPVSCAVNPGLGHEGEALRPAQRRRRIAVVGAGPAGLEAALTLDARGHEVTLIEGLSRVGGMLHVAGVPPYKGEVARLIEYYESMLERSSVDLRVGVSADAGYVERVDPEAVVLATGAVPRGLKVAGAAPVSAVDLLSRGPPPGGRAFLVVGGGEVGLETAEWLSSLGADVSVVEALDSVGRDLELTERPWLLGRLRKGGVRILVNSTVERAEDGYAVVRSGDASVRLPADVVVNAIGMEPRRDLADGLARRGYAVRLIGDCAEPRDILHAVREGHMVGLEI